MKSLKIPNIYIYFLVDIILASSYLVWVVIPFIYFYYNHNIYSNIHYLIFLLSIILMPIGYFLSRVIPRRSKILLYRHSNPKNLSLPILFCLLCFFAFFFRIFFDFGMIENVLNHFLAGFIIAFSLKLLDSTDNKFLVLLLILISLIPFYGMTVRLVWFLIFVLFIYSFYFNYNFLKLFSICVFIFLLGSFFSLYFKQSFNSRISFELYDLLPILIKDLANIESFENAYTFFSSGKILYGAGILSVTVILWFIDNSVFAGSGKLLILSEQNGLSNNIDRSMSVPLPYELIVNFGPIGIIFSFIFGFLVHYIFYLILRSPKFSYTHIFYLISLLSFFVYAFRGDLVFALIPSLIFTLGGYFFNLFLRLRF